MMFYMIVIKEAYFYLIISILIIFSLLILSYIIYALVKRHYKKLQLKKNIDSFSILAHDLKSPLTAIDGYSFLVKQNPDKITEYLDKIDRSSKLMRTLIDDTIESAKLQSRKEELACARTNLNELLSLCLDDIELQMKARGISFKTSIQINNSWVMTDELLLIRILTNLLTNAMKYTKEHGEVIFEAKEEEISFNLSKYVFTIKDTGCGISKDFQKRLFEPFAEEKRMKTDVPSSGLGLFIVKQLIDLMHGKLLVESEENKGSCFTVILELHHLTD